MTDTTTTKTTTLVRSTKSNPVSLKFHIKRRHPTLYIIHKSLHIIRELEHHSSHCHSHASTSISTSNLFNIPQGIKDLLSISSKTFAQISIVIYLQWIGKLPPNLSDIQAIYSQRPTYFPRFKMRKSLFFTLKKMFGIHLTTSPNRRTINRLLLANSIDARSSLFWTPYSLPLEMPTILRKFLLLHITIIGLLAAPFFSPFITRNVRLCSSCKLRGCQTHCSSSCTFLPLLGGSKPNKQKSKKYNEKSRSTNNTRNRKYVRNHRKLDSRKYKPISPKSNVEFTSDKIQHSKKIWIPKQNTTDDNSKNSFNTSSSDSKNSTSSNQFKSNTSGVITRINNDPRPRYPMDILSIEDFQFNIIGISNSYRDEYHEMLILTYQLFLILTKFSPTHITIVRARHLLSNLGFRTEINYILKSNYFRTLTDYLISVDYSKKPNPYYDFQSHTKLGSNTFHLSMMHPAYRNINILAKPWDIINHLEDVENLLKDQQIEAMTYLDETILNFLDPKENPIDQLRQNVIPKYDYNFNRNLNDIEIPPISTNNNIPHTNTRLPPMPDVHPIVQVELPPPPVQFQIPEFGPGIIPITPQVPLNEPELLNTDIPAPKLPIDVINNEDMYYIEPHTFKPRILTKIILSGFLLLSFVPLHLINTVSILTKTKTLNIVKFTQFTNITTTPVHLPLDTGFESHPYASTTTFSFIKNPTFTISDQTHLPHIPIVDMFLANLNKKMFFTLGSTTVILFTYYLFAKPDRQQTTLHFSQLTLKPNLLLDDLRNDNSQRVELKHNPNSIAVLPISVKSLKTKFNIPTYLFWEPVDYSTVIEFNPETLAQFSSPTFGDYSLDDKTLSEKLIYFQKQIHTVNTNRYNLSGIENNHAVIKHNLIKCYQYRNRQIPLFKPKTEAPLPGS